MSGFNANWIPEYYGNDSTIWIYHYIAPNIDDVNLSITNSGPVDVWITANDLATNQLYMIDNLASGIISGFTNSSPLYVDNDKTIASYTYLNLTNNSIVDAAGNATNFAGAGGDTIEVTVTMNQPILTSNPVPELDIPMDLVRQMESAMLLLFQFQTLRMVMMFQLLIH